MNSRRRSRELSTVSIVLTLALGMGCLLASGQASAVKDPYDASSGGSEDMAEQQNGDRWEYDPYYIFPLTRHMSDAELPIAGQVVLYPVAFVIDLVQWPFGTLAGLAGK
jgi:hypothetical protein